MQGYPSIEDKVSEEGTFELGGAYSALLTLKIQNWPDPKTGISPLSGYDFKGAVIKPWIGLTTAVHWRDGEVVEKIQKGVFNVTESPEVNYAISLAAYDNLVKMDAKYSEKSTLAYPATLGQIAADACSVCGVNLATAAFPNSDYSVAKRPDSETITCREILKYVAQLAGCFAKCNRNGDTEIRWYETPEHIFDIGKNAKTVCTALNNTKITGVQIKGNDDAGTVYSSGTSDYAVRITDNPFAQDGLQSLVNALGTQLINTQFASYSASAPMNPAIETGDIVWLTDKKGTRHTTIVSGLQIEFGDSEQFGGYAESEDENQSERFDKADKATETANDAKDTATRAEIKVGDLEIEIQGKVSFSDLSGSGKTEINGDNIVTGKIESANGDWWLDLEEGTFYLSGGTFAGRIEWSNGAYIDLSGGDIEMSSDEGVYIMGQSFAQLSSNGDVEINGDTINLDGDLKIKGEEPYSGTVKIQRGEGEYRDLFFRDGMLVDDNA